MLLTHEQPSWTNTVVSRVCLTLYVLTLERYWLELSRWPNVVRDQGEVYTVKVGRVYCIRVVSLLGTGWERKLPRFPIYSPEASRRGPAP